MGPEAPEVQVVRRRRWRIVALDAAVLLTLALVSMLAVSGVAQADTVTVPPAVASHVGDVADALTVYGGDGNGVTCSTTCSSLAANLTKIPPGANSGAGAKVLTEASQLAEDAGAGSIAFDTLPVIGLGAAAFVGGYAIGSKIASWLGISTPSTDAGPGFSTQMNKYCGNSGCAWIPVRAGTVVNVGRADADNYTAPTDGYFLWTYFFGGGTLTEFCPGGVNAPIGDLPVGVSILGPDQGAASTGCGAGNAAQSLFLPRAVAQTAPIQPYTGGSAQPVPASGTGSVATPLSDPARSKTQAQVEQSIGNQLNTYPAKYPDLVVWLDNQLGGPSPDPTIPTIVIPPECGPGHDGAGCTAALQAAGFTNVIVTTLTDVTLNPAYGADQVAAIAPGVGSRIASGTKVAVSINPDDAPDPTTGGGGLFTPPSPPGIDLSPFKTAGSSACNTFPLGLPCWAVNAVGGLSGAGGAPVFAIPLPYNQTLRLDLSAVQPIVDVLRPLFLFMSVVGIALWLGRKSTSNAAPDDDSD